MTRQQIYDSLVELACKTIPKLDRAELQKMLSIQARVRLSLGCGRIPSCGCPSVE